MDIKRLDSIQRRRPLPAVGRAPHGGFGTPLPRWVRIFIAERDARYRGGGVVTHDLLAVGCTGPPAELRRPAWLSAGVEFLPARPNAPRLRRPIRPSVRASAFGVIQADAASNRMSFSVTVQRTAPLLLLRLLGSTGTSVTAQATATVHPYPPSRQTGGSMVFSGAAHQGFCPSYIRASSRITVNAPFGIAKTQTERS